MDTSIVLHFHHKTFCMCRGLENKIESKKTNVFTLCQQHYIRWLLFKISTYHFLTFEIRGKELIFVGGNSCISDILALKNYWVLNNVYIWIFFSWNKSVFRDTEIWLYHDAKWWVVINFFTHFESSLCILGLWIITCQCK